MKAGTGGQHRSSEDRRRDAATAAAVWLLPVQWWRLEPRAPLARRSSLVGHSTKTPAGQGNDALLHCVVVVTSFVNTRVYSYANMARNRL